MKTVTIAVPDELAEKIADLPASSLPEIIEKGLRAYDDEREFESYLEHLPDFENEADLLEAAHRTKERSQALFEDQGLSAVALLFSDVLAGMLQDKPIADPSLKQLERA